MEMEMQFDPKSVEIPSSKGFLRAKWFHEYMHSNLVKGAFFFNLTDREEQDNVAIELLNRLTVEAEYAMNQVVIVLQSKQDEFLTTYGKAANVVFVKRGTQEYVSALATAEFVISDSVLPSYYIRREDQVFVAIGSKEENDFDRSKNKIFIAEDNTVSCLLNASYLVAPNAAYTLEVYKEKYQLDGLFNGRVIERVEGQGAGKFSEELLLLLLTGKSTLDLVDISKMQKKKLLLMIDMSDNLDRELWKYVSILEEIDTNKYDVTVLLPTAPCCEKLEEMMCLKNRVRVIRKNGRVNYSEEAFMKLARLRHEFKYGDDVECIMENRPAKELKEEWNRLFGRNASFDTACLISPQSVFWDAMFIELDAARKINFRNWIIERDLNDEEVARNYDINKVEVCNYFDQVVSFYPDVIKQYEESGLLTDCSLSLFDDEYCVLRMNREFGHVKINGTKYLEFAVASLDANLLTGDYIIAPKEELDSYFLAINENHVDDIELLLSGLYSFLNDNKGIEIYLGMPYSSNKEILSLLSIKEEYKERIHLLYNYLVTVELLENMDAITEVKYEESKRYRYLAALLGKKYLSIDLSKEYNDKDIVKDTLEALGSAGVEEKASDFEAKQQEQFARIFA